MNRDKNVSMSVIRRLPRYYRFLGDLRKKGIKRISSNELSAKMKLTSSQIRQDFNCFGEFGQQGYGYIVEQLHEEIGNILGITNQYRVILIGAGNLGKAIATHMTFESTGFRLIGIFDQNPNIIGNNIRNIEIFNLLDIDQFCKANKPDVAILCIPREATAQITEKLVNLGINCFWNFSHYDLTLDFPDVIVENVHLGDSLMTLGYRINEKLNK